MTDKVKKLSTKDIQKYIEDTHGSVMYDEVDQIVNRIDYILKKIYSTFGGTCDNWYFDGAEENYLGNVAAAIHYDEVTGFCIESEVKPKRPMYILGSNGKEIDLTWGFPVRWMTEDFESELEEGKENLVKFKAKRTKESKDKKDARKKKDFDLTNKIISKLNKEEIQALRRVLKNIK